eukprot:scaffold228461_cov35-Tisochrysis_lutea.AAC.3
MAQVRSHNRCREIHLCCPLELFKSLGQAMAACSSSAFFPPPDLLALTQQSYRSPSSSRR